MWWYNWISSKIGLRALLFPDGGVADWFVTLSLLGCVIVGYLLGSINSAIITSKKLYGKDIRSFGSGNAGLTNMLRVFGKKAALWTLAGDMLKSVLAVLFGALICYSSEEGAYLAGLFCVLGHIAPIYYRFKGGKGVLSSATMILILDPVVFLLLILTFALVLFIFRYVSLGSVLAAFLYPAYVYLIETAIMHQMPGFFKMLFSVVLAFMVIFMHRSNIARLANGTENRFSFKSKPKKDEDDEDEEDE